LLSNIALGSAVVLPLTAEAGGSIARIHLAPRLTPHARHFGKYVDIPVPEHSAFVFWRDGMAMDKARTLREFIAILERWPVPAIASHMRRHDFSRWIASVFGDYPLSRTVESLESEEVAQANTTVIPSLTQAIRTRYQFLDPKQEASAKCQR